jgi:hypothetical protein
MQWLVFIAASLRVKSGEVGTAFGDTSSVSWVVWTFKQNRFQLCSSELCSSELS